MFPKIMVTVVASCLHVFLFYLMCSSSLWRQIIISPTLTFYIGIYGEFLFHYSYPANSPYFLGGTKNSKTGTDWLHMQTRSLPSPFVV